MQADHESTCDLWVASLNMLINYKNWGQISTERKSNYNSKNKNYNKKSPKSKKLLSSPKHSPELSR